MKELKTFSALVGSGLLAQCLMFISSLIFSRLYPPTSFGELGYYSGFSSLVAVVAGLRFDYIAFSQPMEQRATSFATALVCATGLHALILAALLSANTADFAPSKTSYWLLVFSVATSTFYLATQFLIATAEYQLFARARMTQAVLQLLLGLAFYYVDIKIGLLICYSISQLLVGILLFQRYGKAVLQQKFAQISRRWNSSSSAAAHNTLLILLLYATPFAPILLGTAIYSAEEIGAYFLFSSAFAAPFAVFRRSAINVLNAEVASPHKALVIARSAKKFVPGAVAIALAITLASLLLFGSAGHEVTLIIFGKAWVNYSTLMLPVFLFHFADAILQPFSTLLPLWGHQSLAMKFEVSRFLLVFAGLPTTVLLTQATFYHSLIFFYAIMIFIYGMIFAAICILVMNARIEASS